MARIFCIVSFLILAAVPQAMAMGHAHHGDQGSKHAAAPAADDALPEALSCEVAERTDASMPGHGACLGCCPVRSMAGDVTTVPRAPQAMDAPDGCFLVSPTSHRVDAARPAAPPGIVRLDGWRILRL